MITITNIAKEKLFSLIEESGLKNNVFVRVGVESGGCSGLSYKLDFDENKSDSDKIIEDNGVKIVIDKKVIYT